MITNNPARIVLSPAYDLLSVRVLITAAQDPEEMALTLNGKKSRLKRSDFMMLAQTLKIPEKSAAHAVKRICGSYEKMETLIGKSFLDDRFREQILTVIRDNIAALS